MKTLILTDIYGKKVIPKELLDKNAVVLEPYDIDDKITDEKELYKLFLKNCGHELYLKKAYEKFLKLKPKLIIGFSIGASVAWRLTDKIKSSKTICFYPSQIRNHLDINPTIETIVIFPKKEEHFDLEEIKKELENKKVDIKNSTALHGFMNNKSKNYDKKEQEKFVNFILKYMP